MRSLRGTELPLGPRLAVAVAVLGLLSRPAALPVAVATTAPPAVKLSSHVRLFVSFLALLAYTR